MTSVGALQSPFVPGIVGLARVSERAHGSANDEAPLSMSCLGGGVHRPRLLPGPKSGSRQSGGVERDGTPPLRQAKGDYTPTFARAAAAQPARSVHI